MPPSLQVVCCPSDPVMRFCEAKGFLSKHYDKTKRVVDEALKPGAKVWLRFEGFELDGLKLKGTKEKLVEQISLVSF